MSVRRLSNSFISTEGRGKSSTLLAGYSPAIDEMDLIERVTVGSGGASSITFSSIPGTYQHLQIRFIARVDLGTVLGSISSLYITCNGVTTATYSSHSMQGDGSSVSAGGNTSFSSMARVVHASATRITANPVFAGGVIDILDYADTSKNTTLRGSAGVDYNGSGWNRVGSGLFQSTNAVTSITIGTESPAPGYVQHSTFALYGVKA